MMDPHSFHTLLQSIERLKAEHPELMDDLTFLADTIEGETDAHIVAGKLMESIAEAQADAGAAAALAERYQARRERYAAREDVSRRLLLQLVQATGLRKIKTPAGTVSLRPVPQTVDVFDASAIPSELTRTETRPDRKAIAERLKAGETVPGARLTNGGETIQVRT